MVVKRKQSLEDIEIKTTGGEPKFPPGAVSDIEIAKALTWYTQNRDNKFADKAATDYFKNNNLKVSAAALSKQVLTFGFVCRLLNNGVILSEKQQKWFDEKIKDLQNYKSAKEVVVDEPKNVINIQDRINEKTSEIAGDLEGAIDELILSNFKATPSPFAIMQDRAKGVHATKILEIFKKRRAQYDEALNTKDEQLIEAWSCYTKPQIKKIIALCDLIITDAVKIVGETKQSRKPRKTKKKTPEQLVAKLQYLNEYTPANLKSIDPKLIIGATQLWVYNNKTKKLGIYQTEDAEGLSVKGSTIVNYSESKSITKTLRKPDEVLPNVITGGKVYLRNIMSTLTTKESLLNGRINKDIILIKVQ